MGQDQGLKQFVHDMDRCWIEGRFDDLSGFLADDVIYSSPDGRMSLKGRDAVTGSYRDFMATNQVELFAASNHRATERGDTAIVEYGWQMAWRGDDGRHEQAGREVLVLADRGEGWRVVWRMQIAD